MKKNIICISLLGLMLMGCNKISSMEVSSSSLVSVYLKDEEAKEIMQDILDNYNNYYIENISLSLTIESQVPSLKNSFPYKAHTIVEKKYDSKNKIYNEHGKCFMENEWKDNNDETYYHYENGKTYIYDVYRKTYEYYNDKDAVILLNNVKKMYDKGKESYEDLERLVRYIDEGSSLLSKYSFKSSGKGNLTVYCTDPSSPIYYLNFNDYLIRESSSNTFEISSYGAYDVFEKCKFSYDVNLEVPKRSEYKYID